MKAVKCNSSKRHQGPFRFLAPLEDIFAESRLPGKGSSGSAMPFHTTPSTTVLVSYAIYSCPKAFPYLAGMTKVALSSSTLNSTVSALIFMNV